MSNRCVNHLKYFRVTLTLIPNCFGTFGPNKNPQINSIRYWICELYWINFHMRFWDDQLLTKANHMFFDLGPLLVMNGVIYIYSLNTCVYIYIYLHIPYKWPYTWELASSGGAHLVEGNGIVQTKNWHWGMPWKTLDHRWIFIYSI